MPVAWPPCTSTHDLTHDRQAAIKVLYLVSGEYYTPFDLSPDDQRFIMARALRRTESTRTFLLVENWFEELKAKVKP